MIHEATVTTPLDEALAGTRPGKDWGPTKKGAVGSEGDLLTQLFLSTVSLPCYTYSTMLVSEACPLSSSLYLAVMVLFL